MLVRAPRKFDLPPPVDFCGASISRLDFRNGEPRSWLQLFYC